MKKLSFHEKRSKNLKLFLEHIIEEMLDNKTTVYSCRSCPLFGKTVNKIKASRHAYMHGLPKKRKREINVIYECSFCDEKSNSKQDSVKHYQVNHCETGVSKINCTKCYKDFGDTLSLLKHIRKIHVGIKSFNCDVCHQSFKNIREFIKHNREIHDGDSNVKQAELEICPDCGKSFITRGIV